MILLYTLINFNNQKPYLTHYNASNRMSTLRRALMVSSEKLALSISSASESFIIELGKALDEAKISATSDEYEKLKNAIGVVIGTLEIDLLWPLYTKHPELEPENLKGWQNAP